MNINAKKLLMSNSNFDSPHGLVNKHNFSCAHDIALLIESAMEIDYFRNVVKT